VAALAAAVENAQASGAEARPCVAKPRIPTDHEGLLARLREVNDDELDALLKSTLAQRRIVPGAD
jgi:hypothetical protein